MNESQPLSLIEDILGPSESRFFSTGYRRSEHHLTGVTLREAREKQPCFEAIASLTYPRDWSTKKTMDVTPHLSTIDMLVLAIQMIETHLACCFEFSAGTSRNFRIAEIAVHAGTKPQEDLSNLLATAVRKRCEVSPANPSVMLSTYECRVGRMRAVCQIEHPHGREKAGDLRYQNLGEAAGNLAQRYYWLGYKRERHMLSDIQFDWKKLTADARMDIIVGENTKSASLGHSYIDLFVTCAQLVQCLLYSMDGLSRDESSTLWMIRTHLSESTEPSLQIGSRVRATIAASQLIDLKGERWRNADIVGTLGNKTARVTFAHALPGGRHISPNSQNAAE